VNLEALATGTPVATIAHAASHLTGRQVVPGLAIVTVLLLTLAILFGPGGPRPGLRRKARAARADGRPVDAAELRDPPADAASTPVPPGAL